jgi:hypothetical protein
LQSSSNGLLYFGTNIVDENLVFQLFPTFLNRHEDLLIVQETI